MIRSKFKFLLTAPSRIPHCEYEYTYGLMHYKYNKLTRYYLLEVLVCLDNIKRVIGCDTQKLIKRVCKTLHHEYLHYTIHKLGYGDDDAFNKVCVRYDEELLVSKLMEEL